MSTEAYTCLRCGEAMTEGLIHACPAVETTHGSAALRAIEAEAVRRVLAELAAEVGNLPVWDKRTVPGDFHVKKAAVLGLLAAKAPKGGPTG